MKTRRVPWIVGVVVAGLFMGCAHDEARDARDSEEKLERMFADKSRLAHQLALLDQEQLAMASLALERSSNATVLDFAQSPLLNHSAHLEELYALARSQSLPLARVDLSFPRGATGGSGFEGAVADDDTRFHKEKSRFAQKSAELANREGSDFDRHFLDWVHQAQHQGKDLAKEGLEGFSGDTAFAQLLVQTVSTLQREHRYLDTVRRFIGD